MEAFVGVWNTGLLIKRCCLELRCTMDGDACRSIEEYEMKLDYEANDICLGFLCTTDALICILWSIK